MNKFPADVLIYISNYLDSISFCRCLLICKRFKNLLINYIEKVKLKYIKTNPKYSADYYLTNQKYDIINRLISDKEYFSFLKYLFYYSLEYNCEFLNILLKKTRDEIPSDLLFRCLKKKDWKLADLLFEDYEQILSCGEIRTIIDRNNYPVFEWIINKKILLSDFETISRSIFNGNLDFLKLLQLKNLIPRNNNRFIRIAIRFDRFDCFNLLITNGNINVRTLFNDACNEDQLKYIYYLYQKGYQCDHEIYHFIKKEDKNFIQWLINHKISYQTYKNHLLLFDIKNIFLYHNNKSKTCLSYFYKTAPKDVISKAIHDGYIEEIK